MFTHPLTQTARLTARRSILQTRAYSVKPAARPSGLAGMWAQVPVEAYPLVGIVAFVCCVGVAFGAHAIGKEKENFMEHKSTGNAGVKY